MFDQVARDQRDREAFQEIDYRPGRETTLYFEDEEMSLADLSREDRPRLVMTRDVAEEVLTALFRDRSGFDKDEFTEGWALVPAVAFPSHLRGGGLPGLTIGRWNQIFTEISERAEAARQVAVQQLDENDPQRIELEQLELHVNPHKLRHLGAVNFLDMRYQENDALGIRRDATSGSTNEKLESVGNDPSTRRSGIAFDGFCKGLSG